MSAPILLIGILYDPVTPLPAARKMCSLLLGSKLLVGSNSGLSAPTSRSTALYQETIHSIVHTFRLADYEKEYFLDGTLPPSNTVCEVDYPNPFVAFAQQTNNTSGSS